MIQEYHFQEIDFFIDFPGASIGNIQRLGENYYYLDLRQDSWFWFHLRIERCKDRQIIFQIRDRTPEKEKGCNYWIKHCNSDGSAYCHHPFFSYDGINYAKVEHSELDYHESDVIRFTHTFRRNQAFLCYGIPYLPERLENILQKYQKSEFLKRDIIGKSRLNNPVHRLIIADFSEPCPKEQAWLLCREDQAETTAAFALEAIIENLLDHPSKKFLKNVELNIVPLVSIDAILNGAPFSSGYGYISNRWNGSVEIAELAAIKDAIGKSAVDKKLLFAGKLHGQVGWDNTNYVTHKLRDAYPTFFFANNETTAKILCKNLAPFSLAETMKRIGSRPAGRFESFIEQNYQCNFIFASEIHCESIQIAKEQGWKFFSGVLEYFNSKF